MLRLLALSVPTFNIGTIFQIIILIIVAAILLWAIGKALSLLPDPFKTYGTVIMYIVVALVVCFYLLRWSGLA